MKPPRTTGEALRRRLLALRKRDHEKRQELVERGELHLGYHAEMERVHRENAAELEDVLRAEGWPAVSRVGADASEAAWIVALHAIGLPAFQRRALALLGEAVERGEARPSQWASLVDRIRYNERRPQVYGTLFDWDEHDQMSPWPIEEPEGVDARRRSVGCPPLAESVREVRERTRQGVDRPPKSHAERQAEICDWARRTGWLDA